jgi:hypothetical protein
MATRSPRRSCRRGCAGSRARARRGRSAARPRRPRSGPAPSSTRAAPRATTAAGCAAAAARRRSRRTSRGARAAVDRDAGRLDDGCLHAVPRQPPREPEPRVARLVDQHRTVHVPARPRRAGPIGLDRFQQGLRSRRERASRLASLQPGHVRSNHPALLADLQCEDQGAVDVGRRVARPRNGRLRHRGAPSGSSGGQPIQPRRCPTPIGPVARRVPRALMGSAPERQTGERPGTAFGPHGFSPASDRPITISPSAPRHLRHRPAAQAAVGWRR